MGTNNHASRIGLVWSVIKLIPFALKRPAWDPASVFCHSWSGLADRTFERVDFLLNLSRGKRVLHFGFVDAPFSEERTKAGQLVHFKIKQVASYAYGVDIDQKSIALYRQITGDVENGVVDIISPHEKDIQSLARQFDIILFPEVLEHLANPGLALGNLRQICKLNGGAKLCITTPNAFSVAAIMAAVRDYELVHPEHYYYFSPCTLRRLLTDSGFSNIELGFYSGYQRLNPPGLSKNGVIAVCDVAG
jgi:SAM-dependent methyltransferase